jgi:hypothetical protein
MGAAFTQDIPISKRCGGQLNYGANVGVITDALVAANATVTLLKAAITAAVVRTVDAKPASDCNRALDKLVDLSLLSATHGKTTVAGIVAVSDASTTLTQNFFG